MRERAAPDVEHGVAINSQCENVVLNAGFWLVSFSSSFLPAQRRKDQSHNPIQKLSYYLPGNDLITRYNNTEGLVYKSHYQHEHWRPWLPTWEMLFLQFKNIHFLCFCWSVCGRVFCVHTLSHSCSTNLPISPSISSHWSIRSCFQRVTSLSTEHKGVKPVH